MLLRVIGVVLGFIAANAVASPLPEYPFVFTVGNARIETPPDMVRLSLTVASRNKDEKVAAAAVDSTFNSVISILTAAGTPKADIDASAVDKTPLSHLDESRDRSILDGYEVSRKIKVTGRDLAKYPKMVKALFELPHTQDFSADFDRSDRAKLRADLQAAAARDAKAHAEEMAAPFGRKLGSVRAISQISFPAIPGQFGFPTAGVEMFDRMFKRSVPSQEEFLVPGNITVSETVNVVYELQ
jgi:uncharacterized protein